MSTKWKVKKCMVRGMAVFHNIVTLISIFVSLAEIGIKLASM